MLISTKNLQLLLNKIHTELVFRSLTAKPLIHPWLKEQWEKQKNWCFPWTNWSTLLQNSIMKILLRGSKIKRLNCKDLRSEKRTCEWNWAGGHSKNCQVAGRSWTRRSYLLSTPEIWSKGSCSLWKKVPWMYLNFESGPQYKWQSQATRK